MSQKSGVNDCVANESENKTIFSYTIHTQSLKNKKSFGHDGITTPF